MAARKRNVGREILDGLRQLKRGEHGRVIAVPSVASIREGTGLSQPRFAELLGVSVRTLQEWEQGRRAPPARRGRCCSLQPRIRARSWTWRRRRLVDYMPCNPTPISRCVTTCGCSASCLATP
jgi:putative transcriptional regulator